MYDLLIRLDRSYGCHLALVESIREAAQHHVTIDEATLANCAGTYNYVGGLVGYLLWNQFKVDHCRGSTQEQHWALCNLRGFRYTPVLYNLQYRG